MIIHKLLRGDKRTVKAKKNIYTSIVLKGIDSIIYLLLVPVTLGYLNSYEYGIWLTINSILMWINSFDIGLGNGMRNKLAEAVAKKKYNLGKAYVSTTFFMLIFLMATLIFIGSIAEPFVNWYNILNTNQNQVPHLAEIVYVSFLIFCLNFVFKFIGNVYLAMQLPAVNNFMVTAGHLLSLIVIFILTQTTTGSLLLVAITYSMSPLLVYLISYPITFFKIFPQFRPTFTSFNSKYLKRLFNISIQFFLLQLSSILLFAFANLLISHMFGPENVTPYNVAYRYFSLVPMAMNIIFAPMWSATTDAYAKGDYQWIIKSMQSIHRVLYVAYLTLLFMVIVSPYLYRIWIGTEIEIPLFLSLLIAIYVAVLITSLAYSNFLNGLGKLRLQTINTVLVAVLFVPLCYMLGLKMGISGIIFGMIILNLSGLVLNILQFHKIINNKATGIWNK